MFFLLVATLMSTLTSILWSLPTVFLIPFGIKWEHLRDQRQVTVVSGKIKNSTIRSDNNPAGFIWAFYEDQKLTKDFEIVSSIRIVRFMKSLRIFRWLRTFMPLYIGHITESLDQKGHLQIEIWLLTSEAVFNDLIKSSSYQADLNDIESGLKKKIRIWFKSGCAFRWTYNDVPVTIPAYDDRHQKIVDQVIKRFKESGSFAFALVGSTGGGKTSLVETLVLQLGATLCEGWNPTVPGDYLIDLHHRVGPTQKSPLVVFLDEVDAGVIDKFKHLVKAVYKYVFPEATGKDGWNTLLSNINKGRYPHTILAVASNKTLKQFNDLDPSMFNKYRFPLVFNIKGSPNAVNVAQVIDV